MKNFLGEYRDLFIAPVTVMLLLFAVYAIKGAYPFGSGPIGYYDMYISFVPHYYHTYDFLHGTSDLFYSFYPGCGNNMFATMASFTLSPVNLFFLFVSRDGLIDAMSIFLIFKMMLIAASASFYIKKAHNIKAFLNVLLSVIYAFSGYVVQYYSNLYFLDAVIVFPMFFYFLNKLLREDKCTGYMVCSAFAIAIAPYMSIMIMIFTVFYSSGYIFIVCEKEKKFKAAANLGIYTFIAVMLSMFMLLPSSLQWMDSARVSSTDSSYLNVIKNIKSDFMGIKIFMLFGSEFGIAAFFALVTGKKINKKALSNEDILRIYTLLILFLPVIFEATDLLWHTGSHAHFPFRFAYMLTFFSLDTFIYCIKTYKRPDSVPVSGKGRKLKEICVYAVIVLIPLSMLILAVHGAYFYSFGVAGYTHKSEYYILYFVFMLFIGIVLFLGNRKFSRITAAIIVLLQTLTAGVSFIAPKFNYNELLLNEPMCTIDALKDAVLIRDAIDNANYRKDLSRVKLTYFFLSPNYGFASGIPSVSSWTNGTNTDYINFMNDMGYNSSKSGVFDTEATVFSDALLNVKKIVSDKEITGDVDENLYSYVTSTGKYDIYDCKYTLPFGMIVDKGFADSFSENSDLETQNIFYKALSGDNEPLIEVIDCSRYIKSDELNDTADEADSEVYNYKLDIPIKSDAVIYAMYNRESKNFHIGNKAEPKDTSVNYGESYRFMDENKEFIYTPGFNKQKDAAYPSLTYYRTTLRLGHYSKGTTASLNVISSDFMLDNLQVGVLNLEKLKALSDKFSDKCAYDINVGKADILFKVSGESGKYVFIPVEYDSNWKASLNGKPAKIIPALSNAFMAVELTDGDCSIEMQYVPIQFCIGSAISILGLLLAFAVTFAKKHGKDIADIKILQHAAYLCFSLLSGIMLIIIYIIPILAFPVFLIMDML